MPLLAAFGAWFVGVLGSTITTAFAWWALRGVRRLALTAAYIVASLAITAGFAVALGVLTSSLSIVTPDGFNDACRLLLPGNLTLCISCIVSARLMRFAYIWGIDQLKTKFVINA